MSTKDVVGAGLIEVETLWLVGDFCNAYFLCSIFVSPAGTCCVCSCETTWPQVDCLAHLSLMLCWARTRCRCTSIPQWSLSSRVYLWNGKLTSTAPCARQAEFGDYEPDQPRPLDHMSQWRFAPSQNKEMEEKILELHKSHRSEIIIELLVMKLQYFLRYFELYFSLYLGEWHQHKLTPSF